MPNQPEPVKEPTKEEPKGFTIPEDKDDPYSDIGYRR